MHQKRSGSGFLKACLAGAAVVSLLIVFGMAAPSCNRALSDSLDMGPGDSNAIVRIAVLPSNDILKVDLKQTASKTFSVIAYRADGTSIDITSQVTLTLDNTALGTLSGNTFAASVQNANKVGFAHVTTSFMGFTGTANLTVVWLQLTGNTPDFFFELPPGRIDQMQPLKFATFIQSIDSFFAVDATTSMDKQITSLTNSLMGTIIPGVQKAAASGAFFGVGAIEDFPVSPFGNPNVRAGELDDQPLILLQPMTMDVTAAGNAVAKLLVSGAKTRGIGGDTPEGQIEALFQIATGIGNVVNGTVNIPAHQVAGTLGGVEFRKGALPVITVITDAVFHAKGESNTTLCNPEQIDYSADAGVNGVVHTRTEAKDALKSICAKVIGVSPTIASGLPPGCASFTDLTDFAVATGALVPPAAFDVGGTRPSGCAKDECCTGLGGTGQAPIGSGPDAMCPLVFRVDGSGTDLGNQIVSGITNLAKYSKFDVLTERSGSTAGEDGATIVNGHTSADFIKSITPLDATASPPPTSQLPAIKGNDFTNVVPGATVRFTVNAGNDFQPQQSTPQVFHATIKVRAGGCTDLDQRDVIILVPPLAPLSG